MRQRANRDYGAGEQIRLLREDAGLSRRAFAAKLQADNPRDPRMHVSERTLTRIEDEGSIPTARVKFAIARAFEMVPSQLWGSRAVQLRQAVMA